MCEVILGIVIRNLLAEKSFRRIAKIVSIIFPKRRDVFYRWPFA